MAENFYKTLGLPWGASEEDVKKAFKRQARTWHPDKNGTIQAQIKYQEIYRAMQVLTDPDKRFKWEQEFIQRYGARPKTVKSSGSEVALRPDCTVACASPADPMEEFTSWKDWAKTEDFDDHKESKMSSGSSYGDYNTGTMFTYSEPEIDESFSSAFSDPPVRPKSRDDERNDVTRSSSSLSAANRAGTTHSDRLFAADLPYSLSAGSLDVSGTAKPGARSGAKISSSGLKPYSRISSDSPGSTSSRTKMTSSGIEPTSRKSSGSLGISHGTADMSSSIQPKSSSSGPTLNSSRLSTDSLGLLNSRPTELPSSTPQKSTRGLPTGPSSVSTHATSESTPSNPKPTKEFKVYNPSLQRSWSDKVRGILSGNFAKPMSNPYSEEYPTYRFEPKRSSSGNVSWTGVSATPTSGASSSSRVLAGSHQSRYIGTDDGAGFGGLRPNSSQNKGPTRTPLPHTAIPASRGLLAEDIASPSQRTPRKSGTVQNDPVVLQLVEMGFPVEACKKAVYVTNNAGVEAAMQWLLGHSGDEDFGDPFLLPSKEKSSRAAVSADDGPVATLIALGFTREKSLQALKAADGNIEQAGDWLLSGAVPEVTRKPSTVGECVALERRMVKVQNPELWEGNGLSQDPTLDRAYHQQHSDLQRKPNYREMQEKRRELPAFEHKEEICQRIQTNQVTVIKGETGCGKTTQVPQFILDDFITRGQGSRCRIVCTQPRRISAITMAYFL